MSNEFQLLHEIIFPFTAIGILAVVFYCLTKVGPRR